MLRFTRLAIRSLARGAVAAAAVTALGAPASLPAQSGEAEASVARAGAPSARIEMDPWLVVVGGASARSVRSNIQAIDRALEPYGVRYTRLSSEERALIRRAFDDLLPGERFNRYRLSPPQARAIVFLALGPADSGDCGRPVRRIGRPTRCAQAMDSMSRDAAWIHRTILALSRTGNRRAREIELGELRDMAERARAMVLATPGCGCSAAGPDAEALLTSTRQALDAYEGSSFPAWMALGSERVQRIARLSDMLERTYIHCLNGTAE